MSSYWNDRAKNVYCYKGEAFYTITPVPYYYQRRKVILNLIKDHLKNHNVKSICDYGCGDGEYIRLLHNNTSAKWDGYDISEDMINQTQKLGLNINLGVAGAGIPNDKKFDLIYSVAVFAHVNDDVAQIIFNNFSEHLNNNGYIIICEQVAGGGKKSLWSNIYKKMCV